jgi:Tfp pilus assembly protein PilN
VKPVNLLPEQYRARRPSEAGGSSRIVIGVLAGLLLMVVAYALSANQVNSRKGDIAAANAEIQRAKAQTASQSSYGDFHQVKETREASVKLLAGGRFDWERLMREVSLVLPDGTWVLDMTASTSSDGSSGSSAPGPGASASTPATSAGTAAAAGPATPSLHLVGCAEHQDDVAVLLVRLRKLHDATDASLTESAKEQQEAQAAAQGSTDSAAGGSETCGGGRFKFDVTVTFDLPNASDVEKPSHVPARLGGGS